MASLIRRAGRALRIGFCTALSAVVLSCGGGGSGASLSPGIGGGTPPPTPTADNVVSVVVDAGPSNANVNTLFTSVTVCVPGSTTNCQTIDHIQVDTASFGLRILSAALTLSLPVQPAQNGNALLECTALWTAIAGGRWPWSICK